MSARLESVILALGERKVLALLRDAAANPATSLTAAERRVVGTSKRAGTSTRQRASKAGA